MEDIRELIIGGGGLLIVAIVLHGLWAAWRGRNSLRMKIEPNLVADDAEDWLSGDFPNGGARVRQADPSLSAVPDEEDPLIDGEAPAPRPAWNAEPVEQDYGDPLVASAPILATNAQRGASQASSASNASARGSGKVARFTAPSSESDGGPRAPAAAKLAEAPAAAAPPPDNGALVTVHVLAPQGERFDGEELLCALRTENLKHGDMDIFHRVDPQTRKNLFSVANAVEPGYFVLGEDCSSPGVTAFLQLADDQDNAVALDDMVQTVQSIAQSLGGSVLDGNRRPLTSQTLSEYRNRAAGFSSRRMAG